MLNNGAVLLHGPGVAITRLAKQRMLAFVGIRNHEVNGFGWVRRVGNLFLVHDVFILEQTASGSHSLTSVEARGLYGAQAQVAGRDLSDLRFEFHSHLYGSQPSNVDLEFIAEDDGDYIITAIVCMATGEINCRIDVKKPVELAMQVPLQDWVPPLDGDDLAAIEREVAAKVTTGQPPWRQPAGTALLRRGSAQ